MTMHTLTSLGQDPTPAARSQDAFLLHDPDKADLDGRLAVLVIRMVRLRTLESAAAPAVVVRNERRLIRAAVDDLIETAREPSANPITELQDRS